MVGTKLSQGSAKRRQLPVDLGRQSTHTELVAGLRIDLVLRFLAVADHIRAVGYRCEAARMGRQIKLVLNLRVSFAYRYK